VTEASQRGGGNGSIRSAAEFGLQRGTHIGGGYSATERSRRSVRVGEKLQTLALDLGKLLGFAPPPFTVESPRQLTGGGIGLFDAQFQGNQGFDRDPLAELLLVPDLTDPRRRPQRNYLAPNTAEAFDLREEGRRKLELVSRGGACEREDRFLLCGGEPQIEKQPRLRELVGNPMLSVTRGARQSLAPERWIERRSILEREHRAAGDGRGESALHQSADQHMLEAAPHQFPQIEDLDRSTARGLWRQVEVQRRVLEPASEYR